MKNQITYTIEDQNIGCAKIIINSIKVPTQEEYIRICEEVFSEGNYKDGKVKYLDGAFLGDEMLLAEESKKEKGSKYNKIIFTGPDGDIIATRENYTKIFTKPKTVLKADKSKTSENER